MATNDTPESRALTALVEQLLLTTGPLVSIIEHMTAIQSAGLSSSDEPPVEVFLAELLEEVLAPLVERHGEAKLQSAATIIEDAIEIVTSEIYLVPPGGVGPPRRPGPVLN